MNRRSTRFLQISIAGLDLLMINHALFTAHLIMPDRIGGENLDAYFRFWMFTNSAWLFLCWITYIYNEYDIMSLKSLSQKTVTIYTSWIAIIMAYLFLFRQIELSRIFIITAIATSGFLLIINRLLYLAIRQYFRKGDHISKRVVIVGYNEASKKLASYLEEQTLNTKIVGFCEDVNSVTELSHYPILSNVSNAVEMCKEYEASEIYSTIAPEQDNNIYKLMRQADMECIRFKIIPDLSLFINQPVHIDFLKNMPVLSLRKEPLDDASNQAGKRVFDIVVSLLVIIFILTWLVPLLSLLIKLESKGPVFFRQKRSGKNNKPFNCIKFRSMRVNKDADTVQAKRDDDRFTRIGKFMRKTNLDEFPQFINVLFGEMSIVGPRPHMLRHTEDYSKQDEQYMIRQFLKPGITGWAQVNGFRGEIKEEHQLRGRIECDIWYLENCSLWIDLKIIFLTVYNVFSRNDKNAF